MSLKCGSQNIYLWLGYLSCAQNKKGSRKGEWCRTCDTVYFFFPRHVGFKFIHRAVCGLFAVLCNYQMSFAQEQTTVIRRSIPVLAFTSISTRRFWGLSKKKKQKNKKHRERERGENSGSSHFHCLQWSSFNVYSKMHAGGEREAGTQNFLWWFLPNKITWCATKRSAWKKLWSALTVLLTVPFVATCWLPLNW